jgi:hypothetical protein
MSYCCCEFKNRSGKVYPIQYYVIFIIILSLLVTCCKSPRYDCNIVETGVIVRSSVILLLPLLTLTDDQNEESKMKMKAKINFYVKKVGHLFVLQLTVSDYPFGIYKLFLQLYQYYLIPLLVAQTYMSYCCCEFKNRRQDNGETKMDKRANNDLQNSTLKTKQKSSNGNPTNNQG